MTSNKTKIRLAVLTSLLALGMGLPYLFPRFWTEAPLHETLQRLMYIPAVLAAIWFGLSGGMAATALIVVGAMPLVGREWVSYPFDEKVEEVAEVLLLLVSSLTGYLAHRYRVERRRATRAMADLEGAYADLSVKTSELFTADEQLRRGERLRLLGELSSELAHEIQNPLASIKGAAEILNERCRRKCGTGDFLEILMSEIKRLRSVLDRFLDFARSQDVDTSICDPRKSLADVAKLMAHQMGKQRISLTVDAPEAALCARISDEELKQVFLNLVLNAVQAMPEGGAITAKFDVTGEQLLVTIGDNGPGIKESNRELVFDAFFSTKRGGTGLGLSVVLRILTKNKGSIVLAPQSTGSGATFVITLPFASAPTNSTIGSP